MQPSFVKEVHDKYVEATGLNWNSNIIRKYITPIKVIGTSNSDADLAAVSGEYEKQAATTPRPPILKVSSCSFSFNCKMEEHKRGSYI